MKTSKGIINNLILDVIIGNWTGNHHFTLLDKICWEKVYGKSKYFPICFDFKKLESVDKRAHLLQKMILEKEYVNDGTLTMNLKKMKVKTKFPLVKSINLENWLELARMCTLHNIKFLPQSMFEDIEISNSSFDVNDKCYVILNKKEIRNLENNFGIFINHFDQEYECTILEVMNEIRDSNDICVSK